MEVVDILLDYVKRMNDRSVKVLDFHHPHQLRDMMEHCLDLNDSPQTLEQVSVRLQGDTKVLCTDR